MRKTFIFKCIVIVICFSIIGSLKAQTVEEHGNKDIIPNKEERIYSLSKIWKELEYNFAFPEKLKIANLDSLYLAYLPLVENAPDNYAYYRILCSFMAHFDEAHTRIIPPSTIKNEMPPVVLSNIGKHIFVKNVAQDLLKDIPLNSEVIAVNEVPTEDYLKDSVYQYISAATPHWKFDKAVTEMLNGRPNTKVTLTIQSPKGNLRTIELTRNYQSDQFHLPMADTTKILPLQIKYLSDDIAYLHLSTCNGKDLEQIERTFQQHLNKLLACKGLIIDVRGNRGGTDQAWYPIAFHSISNKEFRDKGKWMSRTHVASYKSYGEWNKYMRDYYEGKAMTEIKHPPYKPNIPDSLKLNQPMIILSGKYVGSASEDFVQLMKEFKRAVIIGEPTVGCMGEPSFVDLPGGYTAMISTKSYQAEDGSQPNDTGILPDIEVKQNFDIFLKGKDNQLEYAIKELKKRTL